MLANMNVGKTSVPVAGRLQVMSDLHVEVGKQYSPFTFPVTAWLLLLAGDMGRSIEYWAITNSMD